MIKTNALSRHNGSKVNRNQDWSIGNVVKVGFLTLKVTGIRAEFDGLPDIYELISLDGSKRYEFVPHNGLTRV